MHFYFLVRVRLGYASPIILMADQQHFPKEKVKT